MYDTHIYDVLFAYKCVKQSQDLPLSLSCSDIRFKCLKQQEHEFHSFGDKFSNLPEKANEKQIKSLNIIDI